MKRSVKIAMALIVVGAAAGGIAFTFVRQHGFSARDRPWKMEAYIARHIRRLAIPSAARKATNPIPATPEVLGEARSHFADHCATCHANDGSGDSEIGRNLYPPAPDMRKPDTQSLSDGELFYIIHNGVRFTGMPAWGGEDPAEDQDSWKLVLFIRHLPKLTAEEVREMKTLNPKSKHEMEEEQDIEKFLRGDEEEASSPAHHH